MQKLNLLFATGTLCAFNMLGQVIPNKDYVSLTGSATKVENFASAVDLSNNSVYLCGEKNNTSTGHDYFLTRYNYDGSVKWTRTYDNVSLLDKANALAIDVNSNVIITGESQSSAGGYDYYTIKYDSTGSVIWGARYNGTSNVDDKAHSVAVDLSGNVYVAGESGETGHGKDFTVIKYNGSTGAQSWIFKKNGNFNGADIANKVLVAGGNVYVCGLIKQTTTNRDVYITCLSASTGSVSWTQTINGTANLDDAALDMKYDGTNLVICGYVANSGAGLDSYFAALNPATGAINFSDNYDAFGADDAASSIVCDGLGNYGVVSMVANGSLLEYHTVSYDSYGNRNFIHEYPTNGTNSSVYPTISVDTLRQHFYVCGTSYMADHSNYDGVLYQVDPNGVRRWIQYHNGASNYDDLHTDIVLDGFGRVYLSSNNGLNNTTYDAALIRYSQTPVYYPGDLDTNEVANPNFAYLENRGQLVNDSIKQEFGVKYYTKKTYPYMYVSNDKLSLQFNTMYLDSVHNDTVQRVDISLIGRNPLTQFYSFKEYPTSYNYYKGLFVSGAIENVKSYAHLMRPNVYNMIDEHLSSDQHGFLEYLVVKPGGKPSAIKYLVSNSTSLSVNGSGDLEIKGFNGKMVWKAPVLFQVDTTNWYTPIVIPVGTGTFAISGNTVTIITPAINPALPLIYKISQPNTAPVATAAIQNMSWNTYLGGAAMDENFGVDTDINNDIYTCGSSFSPYFLGSVNTIAYTPFQGQRKGDMDAMITKVRGSDKQMQWATFIGGTKTSGFSPNTNYNTEYATAIKTSDISSSNRNYVFVVGKTASDDFPHGKAGSFPSTAFDYSCSGLTSGGTLETSFIAGFESSNGFRVWSSGLFNNLLWSEATSIDVNRDGEIIIGGWNKAQPSTPEMITNGVYPAVTPSGGFVKHFGNGYFMALNDQYQVTWSTPSGSKAGGVNQVKWHYRNATIKEAWIVGRAHNFTGNYGLLPVSNSGISYYQSNYGGGFSDGYIARLNFSGYTEDYCTFWGGNDDDELTAVSYLNGSNEVYFGGYSKSTNLDTSYLRTIGNPAHRTTLSGLSDAVVLYYEPVSGGYNYKWGTLFGGNASETVTGFTSDLLGNVFVTGEVKSGSNFVNSLSGFYNQSLLGNQSGATDRNAYVGYFNRFMDNPWMTYMGGYNPTRSLGVAWGNNNKLYIAGGTMSKEDTYPDVDFDPSSNLDFYDGAYIANNNPSSYGFISTYFGFNHFSGSSLRDGTSDASGPLASDGFMAEFIVNYSSVGINEIDGSAVNSSILLYPNPCAETVYLKIKHDKPVTAIRILNQLGQIVKEIQPTGTSLYAVNTADLSSGMYFVTVNTRTDSETLKFIKQ